MGNAKAIVAKATRSCLEGIPSWSHRLMHRDPDDRLANLRTWAGIVAVAIFGLAVNADPADAEPAGAQPVVAGAKVERVAFADLPGWAADDHAQAWRAWLVSCRTQAGNAVPLRAGRAGTATLAGLCRAGLKAGVKNALSARTFFERHFSAFRVTPDGGNGFFTGYYEPEVAGSLTRTGRFQTPLYDRPADLI